MSLKQTWIDQDKTMDASPDVVNEIAHAVIDNEDYIEQLRKDKEFNNVKPFVVNVAFDEGGNLTADKTYDEIITAYNSGKTVMGISTEGGTKTQCLNVVVNTEDGIIAFPLVYETTSMLGFCNSNNEWWVSSYLLATEEYVDGKVGEISNTLEHHILYASEQRGSLEDLTTTDKTSLVSAINELEEKIEGITQDEVIIGATYTDDGFTLYPPEQTYAEIYSALQWDSYSGDYKGVKARFENNANGWAIDLPNVQCGTGDDNAPIVFSGTYGGDVWTFSVTRDNKWSYSVKTLADKSYVDDQIGDIETALDNIITKYGLGGDTV